MCSCGKVVISVTGAPLNSRYCHCKQCQKAMASPSFARVLFDQAQIKLSGDIKSYSSSAELDRLFCGNCGTSIAAWRKDGSVAGIPIVLFEDPSEFPPQEHTWVCERVSWNDLDDGLTQHSKGVNR